MHLKDIPASSKVFVDASIFLAVALNQPKRYTKACREFLARVEKKEVEAFISHVVLDEVLYKLMQTEIAKQHNLRLRDVPHYVEQTPGCISRLTDCWKAVEAVMVLGATVVPLPADFKEVMETCKKYNLLTRDSLHIATMQAHGLDMLASADSDFQRVPWVQLYQP